MICYDDLLHRLLGWVSELRFLSYFFFQCFIWGAITLAGEGETRFVRRCGVCWQLEKVRHNQPSNRACRYLRSALAARWRGSIGPYAMLEGPAVRP